MYHTVKYIVVISIFFFFPVGVEAQTQSYTARHGFYPFIESNMLVDPDWGVIYPSRWLAPMVGISKGNGEMVGCSIVLYGLTFYGGVGYDFIFDPHNKSIPLWHVGAGYTFSTFNDELYNPNSSLMVGLSISESSHYEHKAITLDCRYTQWLGCNRKWGLYGGVGIGVANIIHRSGNPKCTWNLEAGVCYKIRLYTKYEKKYRDQYGL